MDMNFGYLKLEKTLRKATKTSTVDTKYVRSQSDQRLHFLYQSSLTKITESSSFFDPDIFNRMTSLYQKNMDGRQYYIRLDAPYFWIDFLDSLQIHFALKN